MIVFVGIGTLLWPWAFAIPGRHRYRLRVHVLVAFLAIALSMYVYALSLMVPGLAPGGVLPSRCGELASCRAGLRRLELESRTQSRPQGTQRLSRPASASRRPATAAPLPLPHQPTATTNVRTSREGVPRITPKSTRAALRTRLPQHRPRGGLDGATRQE